MDKIKITSSLFDTKAQFKGIESDLYVVDGLLYKILKNEDSINNKIEKVEILKDLNIEDFDPQALIYLKNKVIGYAIPYDKNLKRIDIFEKSRKKKMEILKQVKRKLENLHNNGIIYGDLNLANILQKNGIVSLCDFDNVCVDGHYFDTVSYTEKPYIYKLGKEDLEKLDTYMLNIVTISYLKRIVVSFAINELYNRGLPFVIDTKPNREIAKAMILLDDKDKIKPFIDNQKRYRL